MKKIKLKELLYFTEYNSDIKLYVSSSRLWSYDTEKLVKETNNFNELEDWKNYFVIGLTIDRNDFDETTELHITVYKGE